MTDNGDAFESAAAAAGAEIEPTVRIETDPPEADNEKIQSDPVRPRRGRPRGRGRPRSGRRSSARSTEATATEPKSVSRAPSQTPETATVVIPPLPPEKLVPFLRQIDKAFVRLVGTAPLDEQELKDGAEACAPVLDHYAPLFLSQPWAPAALWAGMVYVPRAVELYDRRKAGGGRKSETFPVSSDPTAPAQTAVV
jgi:hypothetical protein